ncbi:MAG: hypothetical protein R3F20_00280 [Planctomycetota bacterium]
MSEVRNPPVLLVVLVALVAGAAGYFLRGLRADPAPDLGAGVERDPDEPAPKSGARREVPNDEPARTDSVEEIAPEDLEWMRGALAREKERRREAEFQDGDSGLGTLRRIDEFGADPGLLLADFESFVRPLRSAPGDVRVITVTPETINEVFSNYRRGDASRVTFEFTAGVFEPKIELRLDGGEFVTLRGQGMDATTIRAQSDLVFTQGVDNLAVEALTLDGRLRSDGLLDSRGAAAVLLRRVRCLGFDSSAGHSAALGVSARTYIAVESCEFVGGYGHSP